MATNDTYDTPDGWASRWTEYARFMAATRQDPPTWSLGQDPDRCETCGGLLVVNGGDVCCPTCDAGD